MSDIGRTLVAFANADGGELLLGVEDDGTVTGAPYDKEVLTSLLGAASTHIHSDTPIPAPRKAVVQIDGRNVVYFSVMKGTTHVHLTADGRCLRRLDRDSVPVSAEHIQSSRIEDQSREWDRQTSSAKLTDLDLDLVNSVASQIAYGISPEKCLQYLDLAEFSVGGLRLRNAAAVLFAKDVRRWHPRCQVRIVTIAGTEHRSGEHFNVQKDEVVADNILKLIDSAWERLQVSLSAYTQLTPTAKFQQSFLYPQIACREALVNAIVHRNYAIVGAGIEISLFADRLEINSPGRLLSTIAINDLRSLRGVHESRNPLIARVLREVGFIREMGEGVRRIFDVMRSSALAEPELEDRPAGFSVTLYHRSLYDPAVKLWLSTFDEMRLTENQRATMALGYGGREFSTQDIIDRLAIVDVDKVREILTPLRKLHLIERTKDPKQANVEAKRKQLPKRSVPVWRVRTPAPIPQGGSAVQLADPEPSQSTNADTTSLFIANLPYTVTPQALVEFMSQFGNVISLQVPPSQFRAGENRGFAFAEIAATRSWNDLIRAIRDARLLGRQLHVARPMGTLAGKPSRQKPQ